MKRELKVITKRELMDAYAASHTIPMKRELKDE